MPFVKRLERISDQWTAPFLIALAGCASLNPYFFWSTNVGQLITAAVLSIVAIIWVIYKNGFRKIDKIQATGFLLLAAFIIYITVLPREDGGHSKWIVVLPTLVALALLSEDERAKCLDAFITIFAITLIPGIVVWFLVLIGTHIQFTSIGPANVLMTPPGGGGLLYLPGVIFSETNSIVLKWGTVLFRVCGIYDEPGTVGTICALSLAAVRFRLSDWRYSLLFFAGAISFSLAFLALALLGLIVKTVITRDWRAILPAALLIFALSLTLGWISPGVEFVRDSNVTLLKTTPPPSPVETAAALGATATLATTASATTAVVPGTKTTPATSASLTPSAASSTAEDPSKAATPAPVAGAEVVPLMSGHILRQSDYVNDRTLPKMAVLIHEYWASGLKVRLFGIASDASVVKGGMSQVFWRVLTDFGMVGFAILTAGCICVVLPPWIRGGASPWGVLFVVVFVMSFYQRPIIWLPYALLILLCGITASSSAHKRGVNA